MVSMAIRSPVYSQVGTRESIERKPWNAEARNDVFGFFAQSLGLVCAATFLYALGPALGMTLIAVSLAVWSLLRSQIASDEEEEGPAEEGGYDAALNWPAHCANPVWIRRDRFSAVAATTVRSVQRQGV